MCQRESEVELSLAESSIHSDALFRAERTRICAAVFTKLSSGVKPLDSSYRIASSIRPLICRVRVYSCTPKYCMSKRCTHDQPNSLTSFLLELFVGTKISNATAALSLLVCNRSWFKNTSELAHVTWRWSGYDPGCTDGQRKLLFVFF